MGKTKMEMKPIQSPSRRQVTFSKRKNGLLKKAYELSVLCDVEVALIVFSGTGKICEFASHDDMDTLLAKYRLHSETAGNPGATSFQNLKFDESRLQRLHEKMDALQKKEKNMVGEDLEPLTLKELQRLEKELQTGIKRICDRKMGIFSQNSRLLIQKVRFLEEENIELQKKVSSRGDSSTIVSQLSTRGDSSTSATNLDLGLSF